MKITSFCFDFFFQEKKKEDSFALIFKNFEFDGFLMQIVLDGAEQVWERGLEEHLEVLRDYEDADAGGEPRAEVLPAADELDAGGPPPPQHSRHPHRDAGGRRVHRLLVARPLPTQPHLPAAAAGS